MATIGREVVQPPVEDEENLPQYFDFITDAQRDGYDGPGITKVTPPVQWGPHGKGHQCRPPLCKRKYNDF